MLSHVDKMHVFYDFVGNSKLNADWLVLIYLGETCCKIKRLYSTTTCPKALNLNAQQLEY